MRSGTANFFIVILFIFLLIDVYAFRSIRMASANLPQWLKVSIYSVYWLIPAYIVAMTSIIVFYRADMSLENFYYKTFYPMMAVIVLFGLPKITISVFQLLEDLASFSIWAFSKFIKEGNDTNGFVDTIGRRNFITKAGLIVAVVPFLSAAHGIFIGRYNYKVNRFVLKFPNLPKAFNGLKVLQISDWHIGSFRGKKDRIEDVVAMINSQNADLILFTGDLVNNLATEVEEFIPTLQKLKARFGVFSILGNHDYGDYVQWSSQEAYKQNLQHLKDNQKKAGFILLDNKHTLLEKDGEQIALIGIENWGLPPFPQYGDLKSSLKGAEAIPFKLLMSHDPSHWDAQVVDKTNIDLTLSGHTHGMQFGINIPGFKWSPVKYKYPRWSGMYEEKAQKLYVNVGIGYIGFPGRIGFYPEISIFELHQS